MIASIVNLLALIREAGGDPHALAALRAAHSRGAEGRREIRAAERSALISDRLLRIPYT